MSPRADNRLRVDTTAFTCPRCFYTAPLTETLRFCPHCGLADAKEAFLDRAPLDVRVGARTFRVGARLAIGSISTVYHCRFEAGGREVEGAFKIARDARVNDLVANEARILRTVHAAPGADRMAPFLPITHESFRFADGSAAPSRQANVLGMHLEIRSADELYSLQEVKAQYPNGLDARDAAWIWRRLLSVLGSVHAIGIIHTQVLPMHVLIEPRDHKLVLVDWCCAQSHAYHPPAIISAGFRVWYNRADGATSPATRGLDIDFAARCMVELMGGDPIGESFPPHVDPALQRYFQRCLAAKSSAAADAFRLLSDFDQLIEALWGPRTYRPLALAPRIAN